MIRTHVRRRRSLGLACTTVLALVLVAKGAEALDDSPAERVPHSRYVVRSGDSLWSIAVRTGQGRDPRNVMDAIGEANGVEDGRLVAGQLLWIPADA